MYRILFFSFLWWCLFPGVEQAYPASPRPARAQHGMVVSADRLASQVGVEILRKGGNAVDAAVAVGFALAVTFPQAGNIGGGGFMVIRMHDGTITTIDYREKAPAAASRDMFLDEHGAFVPAKSQTGFLSAGVPGSVDGLLLALREYGTVGRREALQPAIDLAEQGFPVCYQFADAMASELPSLLHTPATGSIFTRNGAPFREGDTLTQKDLGRTLRRIQEEGRDGFYDGETADLLVAEMKKGGGMITRQDLDDYQAVERPAVTGTYRGYEIVSMGPPSSGGIGLLEMLNVLEGYDIAGSGFSSSANIALLAESMKLAYADRAEYLGDPDFTSVPQERLVSKEYAREQRSLIDTAHVRPSTSHGMLEGGRETTHYAVVDQWGNAVSTTTTLNSWFGSMIVVEGGGFLLNNEMDDFSAKPGVPNQFGLLGGAANAVAPYKRMLSAMTPTIVVKDGDPYLVLGSPGGSTIITTVLQVLLNVVDHGMDIQEAIDAPRVHHQWFPDTLLYEKRGLPRDVVDGLMRRGYQMEERNGYQGRVEGILISKERGLLLGATDPRGYGAAIGY